MKIGQRNTRADALARLNQRGVDLFCQFVNRFIDDARQNLKNAKHIRAVDIGCGSSPYFTGVNLANVDLYLWDKEDLLNSNHKLAYKPFDQGAFAQVEFPNIPKGIKPFDIVILSGVVHELFEQWTLRRLSGDSNERDPVAFAAWLFCHLRDSRLIHNGSLVLIGEIYNRDIWARDTLVKARLRQLAVCKHADPACVFPDPSTLVYGALQSKWELEVCDEGFSIPESHTIFDGIADPSVRSFFRNRRFYCLAFRNLGRGPKRALRSRRALVEALISQAVRTGAPLRKAIALLNKKLSTLPLETSSKDSERLLSIYDCVFMDGEDCENAIFPSLAGDCASLSRNYFEYRKVAPPKLHVFWLSLNSLVMPGYGTAHTQRYLPAVRSGTTDCGDAQHRCIATTFTNERSALAVSTNAIPEQSPTEWTAIGYDYLGSPDVFEKVCTPFAALKSDAPASIFRYFQKAKAPPKSLTLSYAVPFEGGSQNVNQVSAETIEEAMTASDLLLWRDPKQHITDRHVLFLIDCTDTPNEMVTHIGCLFNRLTGGLYCGQERTFHTRVMEAMATVYLDFQFLRRFTEFGADIHTKMNCLARQKAALKQFEQRWLAGGVEYFSNDRELSTRAASHTAVLLPHSYRERIVAACKRAGELLDAQRGVVLPRIWTTFAPTSALTNKGDSPGNVMLFSDRIHGAMLLDLMAMQVESSFQAVRAVELEWTTVWRVRREGRENEQRMRDEAVSGFSHQVNHMFGDKSSFSLQSFVERTSDTTEDAFVKLSDIWHAAGVDSEAQLQELKAREAQIRYASNVPSVIKAVLKEQPDKNVFGNGQEGRQHPQPFVEEVGYGMVIPLMAQISGRKKYGCAGKRLSLYIQSNPKTHTIFVPSNELTKAALFEVFWNAFRHGHWESSSADAVVSVVISMEHGSGIASKVVVTVSNPRLDAPPLERRGRRYVDQFIRSLQTMQGGAVSAFTNDWDAQLKLYISRLILPFTFRERN